MALSINGAKNGATPTWAAILGYWDTTETKQTFLGRGESTAAHGQEFPIGLAVSSVVMKNGTCGVRIRFSAAFGEDEQAAGIVLGYRSPEQHYTFAELGAARSA